MAVLNACNTFPVTRRDADPIEDLKGGLLVLSNFLKSLPPFVDDITLDIKVQTLCALVRNITELGEILQPTLNETAFLAYRAIANGIKSDGCKWATKASASCNATTVDAFCAKLNFKPVIQAVKQVSGSSNITSGRMWVAQHLDSINKAVVDLINTAINTFALSSSTV
ncbi:hypothetical protein EMCRGX_G019688 [Ephydatia muelleri]